MSRTQLLPGRIPPTEMFPAHDARFRVRRLRLASGVVVRVVECGDATGRPLVLFPGWACPAYTFRHLMPLLPEAGYRAITVELKGHGLSDKPLDPAEYSTASMVAHVGEILDALGSGRVAIGGLSLGAALAARAAAVFTDRVAAVILLSPVGTHGYPGLRLIRLASPRVLVPFFARHLRRSAARFLLWLSSGRWRPNERDLDEYWAPTQFPEHAWAMRELLHRVDWGERRPFQLDTLRIPILLVYGAADRLVRRASLLADARAATNVRVVALDGAGHMIADEAPDAVAREIVHFLRSLSA